VRRTSSPIAVGTGLALLAAVSFGVTTPIVELVGHGLGALSTAALLYAGASLSSLLLGLVRRSEGAPLRRAHLGRLFAIAIVGAGIAPTLLVWGLQRAGAMTGTLLLNLEAVFTVLLAWAVYREPIGRRVIVAVAFMALGGAALTLDTDSSRGWSALGALAIVGATAAWAADNTITRGLAEQDPVLVVAYKGALGALLTGAAAITMHEPMPGVKAAVVLLLCGATGYGLSLRLYLLAQRRIGAARSGSIFAVAPFVGAALVLALGNKEMGVWTAVSAGLFGVGVWLHITERHRHSHEHSAMEHDHPHVHDDGHHGHVHSPPVVGEHSHLHRHQPLRHEHDHALDIHHKHAHD